MPTSRPTLSRLASSLVALLAFAAPARAAAPAPVGIVAAENFYGDVAAQIGGNDVRVTSILDNPDQDPHLFEASPSVGRALSGARIVVYNGIDYDPWMDKLLRRRPRVGPHRDRRRGPRRQEDRRQPAYLVRSRDHAGLCPGAGRGAAKGRSRPTPTPTRSGSPISRRRSSRSQARIAALRQRLAGTPVDRDRAGVRLHVRRPRHAGAQHAVPARGDERHRASGVGRRGVRERPEDPPGEAACLQQPGDRPDRRAHGEAGQGVARARGRGDGN